MENKGLLFIPDISGFTKFVSQSEIEHSKLIIQELLEILIKSNQIGLQISEIEGDAILFYRFGTPPTLKDVYSQVQKMFCEFHRSILAYDMSRYCFCKACRSVTDLSLKVITHYGEFAGYSVQNFNKLIGKDIIIAHQLLKNDIDTHEYWLVTDTLLPNHNPEGFAQWMKWSSSAKEIDNVAINYYFTQLGPLKNEILVEPLEQLNLSGKTKVISATRDYPTDYITLFHAVGDFNHRHQWQQGVKKVELLSHYLPRIGMKCKIYYENGTALINSASYMHQPGKLAFSEINNNDQSVTYYTIEATGEKSSRLTVEYYINENFANILLFNVLKKNRTENNLSRSLSNLDEFARTLVIPQ
jgi:hypothetical protein